MSLLGPNGVPVVGGPKEVRETIGGTEVSFFEDPRVGAQFDPRSLNMMTIAQTLTVINIYVNALCREVVSYRTEKVGLEERIAKLEALLSPETVA